MTVCVPLFTAVQIPELSGQLTAGTGAVIAAPLRIVAGGGAGRRDFGAFKTFLSCGSNDRAWRSGSVDLDCFAAGSCDSAAILMVRAGDFGEYCARAILKVE